MQKKEYYQISLEDVPILLANEALRFIGSPEASSRRELLANRNEFSEDVLPATLLKIVSALEQNKFEWYTDEAQQADAIRGSAHRLEDLLGEKTPSWVTSLAKNGFAYGRNQTILVEA